MPEKFQQVKDNLKGLFGHPFSVSCGNLGVLYMSDVEKGKVFSVHVAHYSAEVETVLKGLSNPNAL